MTLSKPDLQALDLQELKRVAEALRSSRFARSTWDENAIRADRDEREAWARAIEQASGAIATLQAERSQSDFVRKAKADARKQWERAVKAEAERDDLSGLNATLSICNDKLAKERDALQAELSRALEALKPFRDFAADRDRLVWENAPDAMVFIGPTGGASVTVGQFRTAAQVYALLQGRGE